MTNIAIIFAGGTGQRLNNGVDATPKQFLKINGKPIIIHTLELFEKHDDIDKIYIAIHPDYYEYMQELVKHYYITKTAGILNDGVRPNITTEVISSNIECAKKNGNAITCTSCFETILISSNGENPEHVPYRKNTYAAQAPQTFHLGEIVKAHEQTRKTNPTYSDIVDSCTLFKTLDKKTYMVKGNRGNIKITTIEDLYILRSLIRYKEDLEAFEMAGN